MEEDKPKKVHRTATVGRKAEKKKKVKNDQLDPKATRPEDARIRNPKVKTVNG
jgi:hypothetical protein